MHKRCLASLLLLLSMTGSFAAGKASHVVVVVWDGMRPDFVSSAHAPTLAKMASNGVFFASHHSIYITATDVNGAAIATGTHPAHNGVIGNSMLRTLINSNRPVNSSSPEVMRRYDELTQGQFLTRPTVAEILQRAGKTTAVAGSKSMALLQDRNERDDDTCCISLYGSGALPPSVFTALTNRFGSFPPTTPDNPDASPNRLRDEWTTRAVLEHLWSKDVPAYTLIWLSEPDRSQHAGSPGSPRALAAIESSDRQLAAVLAELNRRKVRDRTDIFVVCDHGFSTVERRLNIPGDLVKAGFHAARQFTAPPQSGDILVVAEGGTDFLYVTGHDTATVRRLVQFLQKQDYSGVLFTREPMPGTFALNTAHLDIADAPDVVLSLRWSAGSNSNGVAGLVSVDNNNDPGRGSHASLSPYDIHGTLVAAGPDFRSGFISQTPSGNLDLAPTILHLLGVKPPSPMDGRLLSEALADRSLRHTPGPPVTNRLESTATNDTGIWHQYLKTVRVRKTVYLDEGGANLKPLP